MLELSQYGPGLFSIDASSDPSKFCDDLKFQNQKFANLTNEKGEFAIAIFRHFSPLPPPPPIGVIYPFPINKLD